MARLPTLAVLALFAPVAHAQPTQAPSPTPMPAQAPTPTPTPPRPSPPSSDDDLDIPAAPPTTSPPMTSAPTTSPTPPPTTSPAPPSTTSPTASPTPPSTTSPPSTSPTAAAPAATTGIASSWLDAAELDITGFVQAQGQLDQQSQDQLLQGGTQLNLDNFVVRRARLGVAKRWRTAAFAIELDANTVRGATLGLRRAEAGLILPAANADAPPLAALAVGLTDIPFGRELVESSRVRLFMERSLASLAFFPGEPDIGVRAFGGAGPFRYAVAVMAGEPINERAGTNHSDPNQAKDLLGRVGVEARPTGRVMFAGGVSLLIGRGFHPGTDATKDSIEWRDLNENGAIESGELQSVPGVAATPSENFERWGLGADLEVVLRTGLGLTQLTAEVTVASNLDRGLFVSDPIASGLDTRQLGAYVAVVQDVGRRVFGGLRFDYYDPNLDALDSRGGSLIPVDETITTIAPLVGVRLPHGVRAIVQYDYVADNLARDTRGVPTDLANDRLTARLQVDL